MKTYLRSRWVQAGLVLFVFGTGPLLAIIVAAAMGLTSDPNPNPIGPGCLAGVTFWPALICLLVGVLRVRKEMESKRGPGVSS
jgi:hypothetical protein